MAKYHIGADYKVSECKAFIRSCPLEDFATEEEARKQAFYQRASDELDTDRKRMEDLLNNPDSVTSFTNTDFSGIDKRRTMRHYAEKLDQDFQKNGQDPDFYMLESQLKQHNIQYTKEHDKVSISRIPSPDYYDGKIVSKWSLKVTPGSKNPSARKGEVYELDMENNFEEGLSHAQSILRSTVISNSYRDTSPEIIEQQTNFLKRQLVDAYCTLEEEIHGPAFVWSKTNGHYGTFAGSDPQNITVNVNYQHSIFRGKTFDKFLNGVSYYQALLPDEMDIRVYDNETSQSKSLWAIRYQTGQWSVELRLDGKWYADPVNSPEEARDKVSELIQDYMKTNDEQTAAHKADYVYHLVSDINTSISDFIKAREKEEAEEKAAHALRYAESNGSAGLFGLKKKKKK